MSRERGAAPTITRGEGYLSRLPAGAQALVRQEQASGRLTRLLAAVMEDQQVSLEDLVFVILADLESDLGQTFARLFMDPGEVRAELDAASEAGRRPVILDVVVKDDAKRLVDAMAPEVAEYVRLRPPFAFVLFVVDRLGEPSITMAAPVVRAPASGAVH